MTNSILAIVIGLTLGLATGFLQGRWATPVMLTIGLLTAVPVVWLMQEAPSPHHVITGLVTYFVVMGVVLQLRRDRTPRLGDPARAR